MERKDSFEMVTDLPIDWDEARIRFEYDNDFNLTIAQLSYMTCRSEAEIKRILMHGDR